jgi:hypothetical protein
VFEVGAVRAGGGVDDASGEAVRQDIGELVDGEESGSTEFVLGDNEAIEVRLVKSAAVEDDQQLVAFGRVGCPVHDEHGGQVDVEAEFFFDLAGCGGSGTFAGLDCARRSRTG